MGAVWGAAETPAIPAGAPPWLVALGVVAGLVTTTAPWWGPALARALRSPVPEQSGTEAGTTSAAPSAQRQPMEQADAKMALIEKMLDNVERDQERDREEAARLREENRQLAGRVTRLEAEVASRDRTIEQLHRLLDQYQQPPPPQWRAPPPSRHGL